MYAFQCASHVLKDRCGVPEIHLFRSVESASEALLRRLREQHRTARLREIYETYTKLLWCQVWSNVTRTTDRSTLQLFAAKTGIHSFTCTILYHLVTRYDTCNLDIFGWQVAGARCPAKCQSSKELLRDDLQGIKKVTWQLFRQ